MQREQIPAAAVVAAVAALVSGALLALAATAPVRPLVGLLTQAPVWQALRFTLLQSGLSTVLSVGLAIPVARALARRGHFVGRRLVMRLLTVPLALPALVAVFGIVTVWGRAGWLAAALRLAGAGELPSIYGLAGILIAHVFFNLPFAALLLTARLEAVPSETWRLASQLGFPPWTTLRLIEWPAIRSVLPGVAAIVFLICVTSFTIVLTLGGGPWATTLEVAIYQALRFDFDPPRAVALALLQMAVCLTAMAALHGAGAQMLPIPGVRGSERLRTDSALASRIADGLLIAATVVFVGLPIGTVAVSALWRLGALWAEGGQLLRAAATSLGIASIAGTLSIAAAWSLVVAGRGRGRFAVLARLLSGGGAVLLVVPPFVIGAGWFLLLNHFGLAFMLAPLALVLINALMSLPFVLRILIAADTAAGSTLDRLCANLGIAGWQRFLLVDWPRLRSAFAFAGALAAALSLGDLGIAALFGSERLITLPLLLQQRMGSYRQADAASLAGLLALLCLALFLSGDWIASRRSAIAVADVGA